MLEPSKKSIANDYKECDFLSLLKISFPLSRRDSMAIKSEFCVLIYKKASLYLMFSKGTSNASFPSEVSF